MPVVSPVATLAVGALLLLVSGAARAYEESGAVTGGGTVSGKVVFNGAVPMRQIIPNKDIEVCGGPREDALLEVGPDKGVRNTLVYVADVAGGKAWPAQTEVPQLANRACRFDPDIQVVHPGQIAIVNKDPVLHNTHGYYGRRTAFNTALPNQNQSITAELLKTGTVKVDCDAHGWMEGWVFVRDNPYYAVTGADGKFSIPDVPPGTYKVVVLQPYSKLVEQTVTVAAGKPADLSVELTPLPE